MENDMPGPSTSVSDGSGQMCNVKQDTDDKVEEMNVIVDEKVEEMNVIVDDVLPSEQIDIVGHPPLSPLQHNFPRLPQGHPMHLQPDGSFMLASERMLHIPTMTDIDDYVEYMHQPLQKELMLWYREMSSKRPYQYLSLFELEVKWKAGLVFVNARPTATDTLGLLATWNQHWIDALHQFKIMKMDYDGMDNDCPHCDDFRYSGKHAQDKTGKTKVSKRDMRQLREHIIKEHMPFVMCFICPLCFLTCRSQKQLVEHTIEHGLDKLKSWDFFNSHQDEVSVILPNSSFIPPGPSSFTHFTSCMNEHLVKLHTYLDDPNKMSAPLSLDELKAGFTVPPLTTPAPSQQGKPKKKKVPTATLR